MATKSNKKETFKNIESFPESSYTQTIRTKSSKGYINYFGNAVSKIEKTLRSEDAKNRESIPVTIEEQIAHAKKIKLENQKRAELQKRDHQIFEETRFTNWRGDTKIVEEKGHFEF